MQDPTQRDERNRLSLWHLSWPIGIEMLLQFLMGAVDTVMVSRLGDDSVSAVGVSNQVIVSGITIFALINAGIGVVVARKWGGGLKDQARRTAVLAVQANFVMGLVASLAFLFGSSAILGYMHTPDSVVPLAESYLTVVGANTIIVLLHTVINAVVRSTGNTKSPMYITLGMNGLHLVLNYALIFGIGFFPEMGIQGTALSTTISRIAALAISGWLLWRTFRPHWVAKEWFAIDRGLLREVMRIGVPVSVTAISWGYSQVILISIVSRMGATSLASFTYIQTTQQFIWVIASAIGGGLQIRVGQLFGAGRHDEVERSLGKAIRIGTGLCLLVSAAVYLLGTPILSLFTSNSEIKEISLPILALFVGYQPLRVIGYCISGSLNVVGEARFVAAFSVLGMWVFSAGGAYVLGEMAGWGLMGVFLALLADEAVRSGAFLFRWKQRNKSLYYSRKQLSS
ncbi:MATE family efflux transporter [Cohnella endophytica]|uniref:MATE family efflux transporter n=1 Tax=Cohnella endophytica TaxID=2419778 RepID=A0A494Y3R0_9BACL|nr:MATE family efflux transporter [Cohnella endophytica]RKP57334.1 MATE family efflux transporter [Cohnella endophytica]